VVGDAWKATIRQLSRSVRERRLLLDLSQSDLALHADVSLRRIQQIEAESATANPSLRVLIQLSEALETTVSELLKAERGRPKPTRRRATKTKSTS
jgi:transcriptional regulator with XRE-family HTH domain